MFVAKTSWPKCLWPKLPGQNVCGQNILHFFTSKSELWPNLTTKVFFIEILKEKEKVLVNSIFSISCKVFKTFSHKFQQLCLIIITLPQTTNFRLFQTERVCRHNCKLNRNGIKFSGRVENTGGKRRNFSFCHSVFKRLGPQIRKPKGFFG